MGLALNFPPKRGMRAWGRPAPTPPAQGALPVGITLRLVSLVGSGELGGESCLSVSVGVSVSVSKGQSWLMEAKAVLGLSWRQGGLWCSGLSHPRPFLRVKSCPACAQSCGWAHISRLPVAPSASASSGDCSGSGLGSLCMASVMYPSPGLEREEGGSRCGWEDDGASRRGSAVLDKHPWLWAGRAPRFLSCPPS